MSEFESENTGESQFSRRDLLTLAWCRSKTPAVTAETEAKGKVTLDSSLCTGCGLCALDCPTGALVIASGEAPDTYQLRFKHDACVACGRCIPICPEKCLILERASEPDKLCGPPVVLLEDVVVRCRECGSAIGPRAMVNSLRAKMQAAGQVLSAQWELCPDCKVKSQFSLNGESGVGRKG